MAEKRKTFTTQLDSAQFNPAMQFISTAQQKEQPPRAQGNAAAAGTAQGAKEPPEGYRVNPMYIEKKTRRLQLLLKPTVYDAIKARADAEGVSVNELIGSILETAMR